MTSQLITSLGFSGLKRLAETIDREIEILEKEVTFGLVVDNSNSKFSADIADDVLEEVKALKLEAEGKVVYFQETCHTFPFSDTEERLRDQILSTKLGLKSIFDPMGIIKHYSVRKSWF